MIDVVYRNQRDELVAVETYTGFGYRHGSSSGCSGSRSLDRVDGSTTTSTSEPTSTDMPATGSSSRATAPTDDARTGGSGPIEAGFEPRLLVGDVKAGISLPELRYDVTATTVVLGALATRDWRPMHHDKDFAVERNGTRDIFLNTPNQAAWFERYITDWTGPHGRLGQDRIPDEGLGVPRRHDGAPR